MQRGEHVEERGGAAVRRARLAVGDASRLALAPGGRGLVLGLAHVWRTLRVSKAAKTVAGRLNAGHATTRSVFEYSVVEVVGRLENN
eukprot:5025191-Prymnesium_polylepis.1